MRVAIQGEKGAFSHEALRRMLPRATVVPCAVSKDVFDAVERGRAAAAVIPIENSLAGSVAEHFDLLLSRGLWIQRESRLRIVHNLIAAPGVKLADLREAYSHPVALDQCRDFFRRHRKIRPVPFYDTAGAVKHVVGNCLQHAAGIASRQAAAEYGARILQAGIEDDKQNFTRFFLVSRNKKILPGANKTSLAFAVKNVPGALFKALSVFALRDLSLSKIESRPVKGRPWEYVFYVDILRGRDRASQNALRHLTEICDFVKVLGVYPAAS
ncbi:MAG TPA: prephenate dehydratase [Terriglobales bacterium]|nr:prephenate dehydratase [Terriglobales bacterium]